MKKRTLLVLGLILVIGLTACSPKTSKTAPRSVYSTTKSPVYDTKTKTEGTMKFQMYLLDKDKEHLVKQERQLNVISNIDGSLPVEEWAKYCMSLLISAPNSAVPKNTQILKVSINKDILSVDLSKEFETDLPQNSTTISLALAQIVLSLAEKVEIQQVSFTIDGKVVNDFKRTVQLDKPFNRGQFLSYVTK